MLNLFSDVNHLQKHNLFRLDDYSYLTRVSESSVIIRIVDGSRSLEEGKNSEKTNLSHKQPLHRQLSLQKRNAKVKGYLANIQAQAPKWLTDHIVSYDSLLLMYDPLETSFNSVLAYLVGISANPFKNTTLKGKTHQLDVCYALNDKNHPNDMIAVELATGLKMSDIIKLHSKQQYQVFAIGFMPNFAYLGELSSKLRVPRLERPRQVVPAGAVAIADNQTAVYPSESPGGWHIIGYTAFSFSEPMANNIGPNDVVKFNAIDEYTYHQQLKKVGR